MTRRLHYKNLYDIDHARHLQLRIESGFEFNNNAEDELKRLGARQASGHVVGSGYTLPSLTRTDSAAQIFLVLEGHLVVTKEAIVHGVRACGSSSKHKSAYTPAMITEARSLARAALSRYVVRISGGPSTGQHGLAQSLVRDLLATEQADHIWSTCQSHRSTSQNLVVLLGGVTMPRRARNWPVVAPTPAHYLVKPERRADDVLAEGSTHSPASSRLPRAHRIGERTLSQGELAERCHRLTRA